MLDKDSADQTESTTTGSAPTDDTTDTTDAAASTDTAASTPAARRRRRAASRPAGPPVAAETDEPGEVRSSGRGSDPIFDAPANASARSSEAEAPGSRPIVSDPFAVPAIDVSALRPQQDTAAGEGASTTGADGSSTGDSSTDDGAGTRNRSGGRSRSSGRSTSRRTGEDQGDESASTTDQGATDKDVTDKDATDKDATSETSTGGRRAASGRSGSRSRTRSTASKDAADNEANKTVGKTDDASKTDDGTDIEAEASTTATSDSEQADHQQADDQQADDAVDQKAGQDDAESAENTTASSDESGVDNSQDDNSQDDNGEGGGRRRRRRRGGRRRRRSGTNGDDASDDSSDDSADSSDNGSSSNDNDSSDDSDEGSSSSRRRRRRRRRRGGEDADETARRRANEAVTGIDGSTRLEAKRQRRREGREAGRRRAPILSEAEFLARRESVRRAMVIRQRESLAQIAVLEDDVLVEHYVDHSSTRSLIGNVYLGKVQNVLPSMEAAFIDIGQGRNAVLYAGEVDWDVFDAGGNSKERKIESVLKSGQSVLVQVTKDPIGAKGARLTHHVSLPGRYIVYSPGGHLSGISRKLPDTERKRLKKVLSEHVDDSASVIVRTAAEGASEDELVRDVTRLQTQWEAIEKKVKNGGAPKLMHAEPDPTVRIVRDLFTEDFSELVIAGNGTSEDAYDNIMSYVDQVAPHLADRVKRWDDADGRDVFAAHRIDEQIGKALERKVHLPSGGSLVIDRTEAMTVIDVNTGKFTGSGGNLEATVTSNNLEAAEEIVRQLRLRDIGGIIVIDFIDMVLPSNRELLLRRLVECLGRDRTRHQVAEVTSLGLVQMTRKRIGTGLGEAFTTPCEHCQGKGHVRHDEPVEVKPDNSNGGNGRSRGRSRGGRSSKAKSESPKTPPRQPLPKVMPPPPPGLARVSGTDEPSDGDTDPDLAKDADAGSGPEVPAAADDQQPGDTTGEVDATGPEPTPEDDPVAAAMDALVATRGADA